MMHFFFVLSIFVVIIVCLCVTIPADVSCLSSLDSQEYKQSLQLDGDGKFKIYWNYNETYILFEIHAATRGYIGFGMSPNGKMFPADIVIGWVNNGIVHFAVSICY